MFRFAFCAMALSCFIAAHAEEEKDTCAKGKKHYRATIRHIESGGIGYEDGYTTLETFLASDPSLWRVTPFLDARGHVFNNGKWAANAGTGLRALWGNRAYGVNAYYDYRRTGHFHSNQIGAGLETLGKLFDFRINGYLPIGAKISNPYDAVFKAFSGNSMLVSQKYQSAMKGSDAEFGFHFGKSRLFDFYAAAGPYYFIGKKAPATWGGKARVAGVFKDILTLELSDSYDKTFHNKFQGQVSLSFSFGPRSKVKSQGRTCKEANRLNDRMLQPVNRQEIIVIDKIRANSAAINPATGLPFFFVFVDNTSSSDGTYESPYHSFAQAQDNSSPNDIIYVFPGDGTTAGMDSGIALQANQKFWGSGITHFLQTSEGMISIPAQSTSSPTITNTNIDTEGYGIILSTNNAISGFVITSTWQDSIFGADAQNLDVSSCTFKNAGVYTIKASFSGDATISLTDNQFLDNMNGIQLVLNGTSTIECLNNTFIGQISESAIPLDVTANNNTVALYIENNIFDSNKTGSILFSPNNVINADITVLNNTFTNNAGGYAGGGLGSSIVILPTGTTDRCSIALTGNTFSGNAQNSLFTYNSGEITALEVTASTNTISNPSEGGLKFSSAADTLTLTVVDNVISGCGDNAITITSATLSNSGNITINNNTLTDGQSNGILIEQDFSTLYLTILNNEIDRFQGTGIITYSPTGIDNLILDVSGNTISNCLNNSSNLTSGLAIEQYTNLIGSVTNNTLSNNAEIAVGIDSRIPYASACLSLTGNNSDTGYTLDSYGPGNINLTPCNVEEVNIGTFIGLMNVNLVQSCSTLTPCGP